MSFNGALALRYIAGVMKAGGSLDDALRALVEEAPEPLRAQAAARLAPCGPLSRVRERAARLFPEREFRLARAALTLTQDAGGSVAELLERCARQLDERRRWSQRRKALAAQTIVSAWIVGTMPFGLIVTLSLVAPDYVRPLFQTAPGRLCLAASVLLLSIGLWTVRRMTRS